MSTVDGIDFTGETHRYGGFDIPPAPPVIQLRYKNLKRNSLRYAAPPTPEQPDFAESKSQILRPGGTQNPSVLLPPESACSEANTPFPASAVAKGITH